VVGLFWVIVTKAHHITAARIAQHVVNLLSSKLAILGWRDTCVSGLQECNDTRTPSANIHPSQKTAIRGRPYFNVFRKKVFFRGTIPQTENKIYKLLVCSFDEVYEMNVQLGRAVRPPVWLSASFSS
jgi:hypothetical protein